jgi:preprotein translocase subunit SecB
MTDTESGAPASRRRRRSRPGLRIVAQFVRDLSFENPRAPESLRAGQDQPQIDMNVEMSARAREDGLFEVDLKLSARATREDEDPVFHVEVVYGGLFAIENGVAPRTISSRCCWSSARASCSPSPAG